MRSIFANGSTGGAALGDTFNGIERVFGSKFDDVMTGDGKVQVFFGQGGGDVLIGNDGNDALDWGAGVDVVNGGDGDDRVYAGETAAVSDYYVGGKGNDWIDYGNAANRIALYLTGGAKADHAAGDSVDGFENIKGTIYSDVLQPGVGGRAYGNDGADFIFDSTGTEILRGGMGLDTLTDQAGADTAKDIFFLENGMGRDVISGFNQGVDKFWLSKFQFGALAFDKNGRLDDGQIISNSAPTAIGGAAQLLYDTNDSILSYDADGTGSKPAVQIALLTVGLASLKESDFVVVPEA